LVDSLAEVHRAQARGEVGPTFKAVGYLLKCFRRLSYKADIE
jgi:hypothetical protein